MLRAFVTALLIASCAPATAREFPVIPQPIVLRLTGRLEPDRAAARAERPDVVGMRIGDDLRWLAIDRAVTLGDHPLTGRDVLNVLAPFQDGLTVVGARDLQMRLASAPSGSEVTIEGLVDRGARTLLLRHVQLPAPAASP